MRFTIETVYDQKALTAMARALRKTIRSKRSRRSHIFGWIVTMIALLLIFNAAEFNGKSIVTGLAAITIMITLILEDHINGYVAKKRGLPGLDRALVTFHEEGYHSATPVGASDFRYDTILRFAGTKDYFVFVFSASHAQVYDKENLSGGTESEFAAFITEKTGKQLEVV